MLKSLNKDIKLPKLKLPKFNMPKKLSLPKVKVSKAKVISGGIVAVDAYSKRVYNFADNTISLGNINFYDRKNFYISYLYSKDFMIGSIELSRGISDEDLKDAIEVGAYDELALDSSVDYVIKYLEVFVSNSENRVFNIFAIPVYKLQETFEDIDSIKHIDFLAPAPLLYGGLYKKEYLERGKVDCFVHFDYEDAYLVFYKDGQFVYTKTLTHSLQKINEEFAKLVAQHIDEKEFFNLLTTQGLMIQDSVVQKHLMKIFGDVFNYLNDVVQFAKRSNSIENIDNFYITSKIGDIKGLNEFATNYTNTNVQSLDLTISKNSSEISLDPLAEIMMVFAKDYISENNDEFNFSLFKKEPEFFARPVGKLTKAVAASLVLSLLYPAYQLYEVNDFDKRYQDLSYENNNLQVRVDAMKKALENIASDRKKIDEKLAKRTKDLDFRTKLLKEIYNKKVDYAMKVKVLNDLFARVNRHQSKVERLVAKDKAIFLKIRSAKDKSITELLKDISINPKYDVSTNLIVKDKNSSLYKSEIKVGLNGSF